MYENAFDLIVSDIMMPDVDGYEFAKTVRSLNEDIPILFMTARDDFASKQRGYRIGIDDYMVKPIDLDELFLRIGALLRRAKIAASHKLEIGKLRLDMDERTALYDGEEIAMTTREFNIIYKLLSFYAVTIAIVNIVKTRKHKSPILSAARAINLVAAMVSILSLTTAMLAQFGGEGNAEFNRTMTAAVGGGVCTIVIAMAIYMIVRANRKLQKSKSTNPIHNRIDL